MEIDAKPEDLQVFPLEEDKKYLNKSLYIPARQTNMMRIIELFWRHKYGSLICLSSSISVYENM